MDKPSPPRNIESRYDLTATVVLLAGNVLDTVAQIPHRLVARGMNSPSLHYREGV